MWWVGGSHLINFWAIWSGGSKETHVVADIRYILPACSHTYKISTLFKMTKNRIELYSKLITSD